MSNQNTAKESTFSFREALKSVLNDLTPRAKEIVDLRFGIFTPEPLTLEEIGKKYGITRERVRQILKEALKKAAKRRDQANFRKAEDRIKFTLEQRNGIIRDDEVLELLAGNDRDELGAVHFILNASPEFHEAKEAGELANAWTDSTFEILKWRELKEKAKAYLEVKHEPVNEKELFVGAGADADRKHFFNYLSVSEEIRSNKFGQWGLRGWEEITPKGTREKAYLVLKQFGKPLYFRKVAELIDKNGLNKRATNPQTVHNELIKDKRFVLVGRGIYALAEWGYQRGTVKDILQGILEKSAEPMSKEDVIAKILEVRQVKKSTIVINLNNFFAKVGKDKYTVKK